jgi:phytanoyl-CoA hydroxylase
MTFLTEEQIKFYDENGYLVIEKFWSKDQCIEMKEAMNVILAEFDYEKQRAAVFSTSEQTRKSDDYFLTSGDKIRFFWEEKAWIDGKLTKEPALAINKVGHALHDINLVFRKHSYADNVVQICHDCGVVKPVAVQSMYIFKQPFIGGEVNAHQDGTFLYTRPQSVLGLWWALDDCTTENGCLWAVPGSHRLGVERRFKRKSDNTGTEFDPPAISKPWDLSNAVPLIIPTGSLVLLHSALVHYSDSNSSPTARHAYSIHVVDGSDGIVYPTDNWLQRPRDSEYPFIYMDKAKQVFSREKNKDKDTVVGEETSYKSEDCFYRV